MPVERGLIDHDITYNTTITVAESGSDIRITTGLGRGWDYLGIGSVPHAIIALVIVKKPYMMSTA